MINLNLLKIFSKVSELGSFSKAAEALKMPKSRVSRSIARLEEDLGVQLIRRTTRHTTLTSAGQKFHQRIQLLIQQIEEEVDALSESKEELTGTLRITAPEDIAQTVLSDLISQYSKQFPQVEVESIITNDFLDLSKDNIDLAFRVGRQKDSNLKQRKLFSTRLIMVASPSYIRNFGRPTVLPDLKKHRLLIFKNFFEILFPNIPLNEKSKARVIRSDSFPMLLKLAINGHGITVLPNFFCNKEIENGVLQRVLPQWQGDEAEVNLVFPPNKNMPSRARSFIELAASTEFNVD